MEDEREREENVVTCNDVPSSFSHRRTESLSLGRDNKRKEGRKEGRKEQKETEGFLPERAVPPPLPLPQSRRHRCL